jgi:endonuclease/exonuclease/phosphatase family metal-dependent hydrolase
VPAALRVATFNIRNGRAFDGWNSWPFRRTATLEAIRSLDADVIGLQEAFGFQLRWLARRLPGYDVAGVGRSRRSRGEHCPVLVRSSRARVVEHSTRWFGPTPERPGTRLPGAAFPRIVTTAVLDVDGTTVHVVNTHLDARSPENRRAALTQVAAAVDPSRPTIVMGDLNAAPTDPELAPLLDAGLRPALGSGAGGTNHDFSGRTDGRRIDHIFVSDHVRVVHADVVVVRPGGRLPSDHWPVVAQLQLPQT